MEPLPLDSIVAQLLKFPMLIDNVWEPFLVNGAHNNGGNANFAVDGGAYLTFYDNQVQIGNSSQNWNLKISHDMSATANMQALEQ